MYQVGRMVCSVVRGPLLVWLGFEFGFLGEDGNGERGECRRGE